MDHSFDAPAFSLASKQFNLIADYLDISPSMREPLFWPKRCIAVSLPVKMDDGSIENFEGYRVQHHLAMGPTKGGIRFTPTLTMGEVAALAIWMSWKCALTGLPYGGASGGGGGEAQPLSLARVQMRSSPLLREMTSAFCPPDLITCPGLWAGDVGRCLVVGT